MRFARFEDMKEIYNIELLTSPPREVRNKDKISFYQRAGFYKVGLSLSSHGGAVWYNMKIDF